MFYASLFTNSGRCVFLARRQIIHASDRVATKHDVNELKDRFDRSEVGFDGIQETMRDQTKAYMVATIGAMTVNTTIFGTMLAVLR